jgi:hypothetical protein
MQALWRTLRNPSDQIAHVAFRVLGKFGGGNRKMMIEPQALEFIDQDDIGPLLSIAFVDHKQTLSLPVKDIIEVKKISTSLLVNSKNNFTCTVYKNSFMWFLCVDV